MGSSAGAILCADLVLSCEYRCLINYKWDLTYLEDVRLSFEGADAQPF